MKHIQSFEVFSTNAFNHSIAPQSLAKWCNPSWSYRHLAMKHNFNMWCMPLLEHQSPWLNDFETFVPFLEIQTKIAHQ